MDLYKAIRELYEEKKRLEEAIASLEELLEVKATNVDLNLDGFRKRRGRKGMSQEERRKVSERMKKYWAQRRSKVSRPAQA
ncbi:MAG: hypothetical protein ABFD60_11810 [Bryobacteraceae bacterium]